jgi:hypothetical protein
MISVDIQKALPEMKIFPGGFVYCNGFYSYLREDRQSQEFDYLY